MEKSFISKEVCCIHCYIFLHFQIRKPLVEKRRRDRMNNSLEQLKSLLAVNIIQTVSQHFNKHF